MLHKNLFKVLILKYFKFQFVPLLRIFPFKIILWNAVGGVFKFILFLSNTKFLQIHLLTL